MWCNILSSPPSLLFNFRYLVRFLLSIDVIHVDVGRGHSRFHRMRRMRLVLDIAQHFGLFWLFNRKRMMNTTDDEKKKNCGRSSFSADPSAIKWKLNDLSNKNLRFSVSILWTVDIQHLTTLNRLAAKCIRGIVYSIDRPSLVCLFVHIQSSSNFHTMGSIISHN
jgi:hypothetical protein